MPRKTSFRYRPSERLISKRFCHRWYTEKVLTGWKWNRPVAFHKYKGRREHSEYEERNFIRISLAIPRLVCTQISRFKEVIIFRYAPWFASNFSMFVKDIKGAMDIHLHGWHLKENVGWKVPIFDNHHWFHQSGKLRFGKRFLVGTGCIPPGYAAAVPHTRSCRRRSCLSNRRGASNRMSVPYFGNLSSTERNIHLVGSQCERRNHETAPLVRKLLTWSHIHSIGRIYGASAEMGTKRHKIVTGIGQRSTK